MAVTVTALRRVGRNVSDLAAAAAFYEEALGFQPAGAVIEDPALAEFLGVERVRLLRMRLGSQEIELSVCFPPGARCPPNMRADDLAFQHIAIVTKDIAGAYRHVMKIGATAISRYGPVRLPVASGGVTAFKFRDPDGHALEFLQFPAAAPGYDHSAISVANVQRSVAFYAGLGLVVTAQQLNQGAEQDALDGLANVAVEVVALRPAQPTPHVELLCYRGVQAAVPYAPGDVGADRLVFAGNGDGLVLLRDPDGHVVLIDGRK